jgi:hypothetical protein
VPAPAPAPAQLAPPFFTVNTSADGAHGAARSSGSGGAGSSAGGATTASLTLSTLSGAEGGGEGGGRDGSGSGSETCAGPPIIDSARLARASIRVRDSRGDPVRVRIVPPAWGARPDVSIEGAVALAPGAPLASATLTVRGAAPREVALRCEGAGLSFSRVVAVGDLPRPYRELYALGEATVRAARARTPKVLLTSADGAAALMEDGPRPSFHISLALPARSGGAVVWRAVLRLRDGRLLVLPPPGGGAPVACYTGGAGGAGADALTPPRGGPRVVPPEELPPHAVALHALAARLLPRCVRLCGEGEGGAGEGAGEEGGGGDEEGGGEEEEEEGGATRRFRTHHARSPFPIFLREQARWVDAPTRRALERAMEAARGARRAGGLSADSANAVRA